MKSIAIGRRSIGPGHATYIVAEISANHNHDLGHAVRLIEAAKEAGVDAVKLQTYTPDTLTIPSEQAWFRIRGGTSWDGRTLYDLYSEAYTPWEWHPRLQSAALELGLDFFSTAFDPTSVDFLEQLNVPVHKVASFEIVDLALIRKMAATGKPLILSTGMATREEIGEAVAAAREAGAAEIALLKCTSGYPALPQEMHLRTIPEMAESFSTPVGLSDHTLGISVPVAAIALGACMIEKHFTLSRSMPGPDSAFSLEPWEFRALVEAVRTAEQALGTVHYGPSEKEAGSRIFRRSLFAVRSIRRGEEFTSDNIRSIRPSHGLACKHYDEILGRKASADILEGTPLCWDLIG